MNGWKRVRGDDQKHSSLKCNGTSYNGSENAYVCRNRSRAPTTKIKQEKKEENYAVTDSGCMGDFM